MVTEKNMADIYGQAQPMMHDENVSFGYALEMAQAAAYQYKIQSRSISGKSEPDLVARLERVLKALEVLIHPSEVLGVRDAKSSFSTLLNGASAGDVALIQAGSGGTVALVSTEVLADAFSALEQAREVTFASLLEELPYASNELQDFALTHRPPDRTRFFAADSETP